MASRARASLAPTFLPFKSKVTVHYTRAALIQPLILEDSVQVLVCPLSLEPHVPDKVPLAAHAQALKQRYRRCIFTISNRDNTMQYLFLDRHEPVYNRFRPDARHAHRSSKRSLRRAHPFP